MVRLELTAGNWPEMQLKLRAILSEPAPAIPEAPQAEPAPEPKPEPAKPKAKRKARAKAKPTEPAPEPEPEPPNVVPMTAKTDEEEALKARFKTLVARDYDAAFEVLESIGCDSFTDVVDSDKLSELDSAMAEKEAAVG